MTTELLPPGQPLLNGVLRALPAGLLLVAATRVLPPTGEWWWRSMVLGTLNIGAFFALLFVAAYRLPGGVAAILISLQPLTVAMLAVPLLGERLSLRRVVAGIGGVQEWACWCCAPTPGSTRSASGASSSALTSG